MTTTTANPSIGAAARWSRRAPLIPALVFMILVTQVPFVLTLIISLFKWNALYPNEVQFNWLGNYVVAFSNPALLNAMLATVEITVTVVLVSLVLGLLLALLLDRRFRGRGIVRTLLISPFLVVPIAAALVWKHALLNPSYGLFNGILAWWGDVVGVPAPQPAWISQLPMAAVDAVLIWQWTPFMMLILLAGLQGRDLSIVEAARIDGAGEWQIFRYLTFPHLRRYLELAGLLGSIYIVQNFDAVFTVTTGSLGTANLPFIIHQQFFLGSDYGGASASGVVVVIATMAIATFALRAVSGLLKEQS
jgi:sorbitol/mannitol transport system permease protein